MMWELEEFLPVRQGEFLGGLSSRALAYVSCLILLFLPL
jgi:hypothetical protein